MGLSISKKYNNPFDNIRENCERFYNKGFKRWRICPIFLFISPGKLIALCGVFITMLLCGVGLYGFIVIILLLLLFIFVP